MRGGKAGTSHVVRIKRSVSSQRVQMSNKRVKGQVENPRSLQSSVDGIVDLRSLNAATVNKIILL